MTLDPFKASASVLSGKISGEELSDHKLPKVAKKSDHWGYHLLLDLSGCNGNIDDEEMVKEFFKELIPAIKMKKLSDVVVKRAPKEEGRGLSAVQMITTSSITFHGDDENWCAYIDIFSCKVFDPKSAYEVVAKFFEPAKVGYRWVYRDAGKWPRK